MAEEESEVKDVLTLLKRDIMLLRLMYLFGPLSNLYIGIWKYRV
jgi:hypothetical protein